MVVRATPDRSTIFHTQYAQHGLPAHPSSTEAWCEFALGCTIHLEVNVRSVVSPVPGWGRRGCRGCRGCRGILEPRVCTLVNIQTNRLPIIPFAPNLRAPSRHEERHGGTETRRHGDTTTSRLGVSCQAHLILSWPDRSNAAGGPCWFATTFGHHWFGSPS